MKYNNIIVDKVNTVLSIKLNRTEFLNALTREMKLELIDVLQKSEVNPEIKVILLSGAGRGFSAGGDIKKMGDTTPLDSYDYLGITKDLILLMSKLSKPIIAAVHGHAAGGGASLALACDLILSSENAKFSFGFSKIGLIPDNGGVFFLSNTIGIYRTKELLFKGGSLEANKAHGLGLVNHILEEEEFCEKAMEYSEKLAEGSAEAMEHIKRITNKTLVDSLEGILDTEQAIQPIILTSENHQEGVRAFLEKRNPKFNS